MAEVPRPGHAAEPGGARFHDAHIPAQPFTDDDGSAPPQVAEALESGSMEDLVLALRGRRLLVALVAALDSVTVTGEEKDSHMAAAMWQRPDGKTALLAFSSVAALSAWDPHARPLPVPTAQVAQAALEDGAAALLIDKRIAVTGPALWALAQNRPLLSPAEDPDVRLRVQQVVTELLSGSGLPLDHHLVADDRHQLTVVLQPQTATRRDLLQLLATQLAGDPMLRARTTGMRLAVIPSGSSASTGSRG